MCPIVRSVGFSQDIDHVQVLGLSFAFAKEANSSTENKSICNTTFRNKIVRIEYVYEVVLD